jgi:hypothetical protein
VWYLLKLIRDTSNKTRDMKRRGFDCVIDEAEDRSFEKEH